MNPLAFLPLLAAVAVAAPGVLLASQPHAYTIAAPAVQAVQYQVPLTQTVHYEQKPVVTGYQTTIVKPQIAAPQIAVSGIAPNIVINRQFPELAPPTNSTTPPPIGDAPTLPPLAPPTAPPSENGTSGDQGGQQPQPPIPIPGIPGGANFLQIVNPAQLQFSSLAVPQTFAVQQTVAAAPVVQQVAVAQPVAAVAKPAADAIVVEARAAVPAVAQVAQVAQVATVRAAQAGDFEPLVTKEKVLAPVRTHTEITPQLTQIQPEVTVRKVIQEIPVATPVAVQTPVIQQWQTVQQLSAPVVQTVQTAGLPAAQIISA